MRRGGRKGKAGDAEKDFQIGETFWKMGTNCLSQTNFWAAPAIVLLN